MDYNSVYEDGEYEQPVPQSQGLSTPQRCCIEGSGEIIGYWGKDTEVMNGWTTIPHGMNVRLDYPERHNITMQKPQCLVFSFQTWKYPYWMIRFWWLVGSIGCL